MKRPSLTRLVGAAALVAGAVLMLIPSTASAKASVNLEQCENNDPTCDTAHPGRWITGNLGSSNADYAEGEAVPYRSVLSDLTVGATYMVRLEWDTTKSGRHAIDYLVDYDFSEASADPCAGITCGPTTSSLTIPMDSNVSGGGVTQVGGQVMTLRGGTFPVPGASIANTGNLCAGATCTVPTPGYTLSGTYAGDSSTSMSVWLTATSTTAVLSWGGHIASRADWGLNNSAASINGSPYHMKLNDFACSNARNCSTGEKDLSLSSAAVVLPGSITITKQASPEGATSFEFGAGPSPLTNFTLVDDGSASASRAFTGITAFGTFTITEQSTTGWDFDSANCSVTGANGGSQTVDGATVTIDLREGEAVSCTYGNTVEPIEALSLAKTASPTVYSGAAEEITYTYVITNTGTATLGPEQFQIDDDRINGGDPFDCGPADTTLEPGETATCTATYTTTDADVTAGSVTNVAFALGSAESDPVSATVVYQAPGAPGLPVLSLAKSASQSTFSAAGETITYTYVVTNTGTAAEGPTQVTIDDDKINGGAPFPCGPANTTLAPGATLSCTATYTTTDADVTAGSVTNVAFAAGSATSKPVSVTVVFDGVVAFGNTESLPRTGIGLGLMVIATGLVAVGLAALANEQMKRRRKKEISASTRN